MNDEMLPDLQILFNSIYPNDPCTVRKLLYKEDHPNHVVTLVARSQKELIGQANIFQKDLLGGIINIGCHVAENYRRQGVGTKLTEEAIKSQLRKVARNFI